MNQFLQKLERRFGRYAVPHLTYVLIGCYALGYLMELLFPTVAMYMCLDTYAILHGQIWRLVTWVIIPPSSPSIFAIILLLFYFSIGTALERVWGDFRYNIYVLGGMLVSIVAAFIAFAVFTLIAGYPAQQVGIWTGIHAFSTYYVSMSLLLAYAATFPDAVVLLMFIIPIPMKYLGILYGILVGYNLVDRIQRAVRSTPLYWLDAVAIAASLLNFLLFFVTLRNSFHIHLTREQKQRRKQFREAVNRKNFGGRKPAGGEEHITSIRQYRHRCSICGKTDVSDPDMEFRYCSKCQGAHEYCMDHLYTHVHITAGQDDASE